MQKVGTNVQYKVNGGAAINELQCLLMSESLELTVARNFIEF